MDRIGSGIHARVIHARVIHARKIMVGCLGPVQKGIIHLGQSLKCVEMSFIAESEINVWHACVDILGPVALSVPPTHDAASAVPLQQNTLQQGGIVAAQQNLQPPKNLYQLIVLSLGIIELDKDQRPTL